MIAQQELESIFSVTYFEDFVDACENSPFQVLKSLYHDRLEPSEFNHEETLREIEDAVFDLSEVSELGSQSLAGLYDLSACALDGCSKKFRVVNELEAYLEEKARVLELDRKNMVTKQPVIQPSLSNNLSQRESNGGTMIPKEDNSDSRTKPLGRPPKQQRRSKRKSTPLPVRDVEPFEQQSIEEMCFDGGTDLPGKWDQGTEQNPGSSQPTTPVCPSSVTRGRRRRRNGIKQRRKRRSRKKYCFCKQERPGDMIACDNRESCPVEWFHFSCVQLTSAPRGKWYCRSCRGDRANVMKLKQPALEQASIGKSIQSSAVSTDSQIIP